MIFSGGMLSLSCAPSAICADPVVSISPLWVVLIASIMIFLSCGLDTLSWNHCRRLSTCTKDCFPGIISPIWSSPITSQTLMNPCARVAKKSSTITTWCQSFGIAGMIAWTRKVLFVRNSSGDFSSKHCSISEFNGALTPKFVNLGHVRLVCFGVPQVFKHSEQPFDVFSLLISVQLLESACILVLLVPNSLAKLGFLFVPTAPPNKKER